VNRLQARLQSLQSERRKALVVFITAGDPTPDATVPAMRALVAGGADVIELGMPFSDPEAEGPSIQASSERALRAGVRVASILEMVHAFRETDRATPVLLMGYVNAVERMGYETFAERAAAAGADGAILVNLPPEESETLLAAFRRRGLDLVFMVAPTTTAERLQRIAAVASGFLYYVSLKGVTGARHLEADSVPARVAAIRRASTLPVVVGFGIRDGDAAARVAASADGVAIGSVLVETMGRLAETPAAIPGALTAQVRVLRAALDAS
jgi:tryptophan synthase alpha chain